MVKTKQLLLVVVILISSFSFAKAQSFEIVQGFNLSYFGIGSNGVRPTSFSSSPGSGFNIGFNYWLDRRKQFNTSVVFSVQFLHQKGKVESIYNSNQALISSFTFNEHFLILGIQPMVYQVADERIELSLGAEFAISIFDRTTYFENLSSITSFSSFFHTINAASPNNTYAGFLRIGIGYNFQLTDSTLMTPRFIFRFADIKKDDVSREERMYALEFGFRF